MSWAASAYAAIRKIVLLEDRMENLTTQVDNLATAFSDLDRRLIRLEAKFELLERMASPSRRALPEKSEK
jgi:predicted  nucleic acid-binding Zn-ribbon protein